MILRIALITLVLVAPAYAQQAQTPENKAYSFRIGQEVNANLACSTQVFTLQDKLTASESEVRRLTDKYEPKPEPK